MLKSVEKLQEVGLRVTAGFIVGFDSDHPGIFERLSSFIQNSGIVTAMVGLLNAPKDTKLYKRLSQEGRLVKNISGCNTDFSMNFVPKMDHSALISGYKSIIDKIYSPAPFYKRVKKFLQDYRPFAKEPFRIRFVELRALFKTMLLIGVIGRERFHYWKLFFWTIFRKPALFSVAMTMSVYGYHFRKVLDQ